MLGFGAIAELPIAAIPSGSAAFNATVASLQGQTAASTVVIPLNATIASSQGQTSSANGTIVLNASTTSLQGQTSSANGTIVLNATGASSQGQTSSASAAVLINATAASLQGQTSSATGTIVLNASTTSSQGQTSSGLGGQVLSGAVTSTQGQTSGSNGSIVLSATAASAQGQTSSATATTGSGASNGLRRWLIQYYTDEQAKRAAKRAEPATSAKPKRRKKVEPEDTFEPIDLRAFVRQSEDFALQLQELSDATTRSYWMSQNALKLGDLVSRASLAAAEAQATLRQQEDEELLAIMDFMR